MAVVYKSNGGIIGDGIRITRVSNGGQKLEVLTDAKAGTYSEVILKGEGGAAQPAEPPSEEPASGGETVPPPSVPPVVAPPVVAPPAPPPKPSPGPPADEVVVEVESREPPRPWVLSPPLAVT